MSGHEILYAGLVLPDASDLDLESYLAAAEEALDSVEPYSDRAPVRSTKRTAVLGAEYGICVRFEPDSDYGPRVVLDIIARKGVLFDEDLAAKILSDAVLIALETSPADIIEWCSSDVLMDRADFIRLRSYVSPHRMSAIEVDDLNLSTDFRDALFAAEAEMAAQQSDHSIKERVAVLKERVTEAEPARMRMGAASWALTVVIGLVCLPVAAALSVIGVIRGMDFRLATQALSVTMLFVVLDNTHGLSVLLQRVLH